ncbi:20-hydroxyecdysone protein [Drosophila serrata]|uniref:20-hydroxyecdysone protein n=1 Tax=Drosophila serrata TaxID=7274 RepID=UPI000A1D3840|nr:20-hydroxyecdysone protein [Drosophila serrata]
MKPIALILLFLAASQARVVQLPQDIPVTVVEEKQQPAPVALPLVKEEIKPRLEENIPTIKEELKPEIKPEIKEEIIPEIKPEIKEELKPEIKQEIKEELKPEIKPEIKDELKPEIKPEIKEEIKPEIKEEIKEKFNERIKELKKATEEIQDLKEKPQEIKEETPALLELIPEEPKPAAINLKTLSAEESAPVPDAAQDLSPLEQNQSENQEDPAHPQVRQATQATPTQQSTTQGNFVQQLIQNSPIGQFLNQFQPQQQQPQPAAPAAVQSDDAAAQPTPAPTVPGFLNPQAAFTQATQVVQNAAQSVVNSTTQAFQGIQQFASNLGNQFQNTLSGLTNSQPAVSTTPRPPGPIQQFVNNVFGGNNNATAAAPAQQQQGGNPLQGIINFLGGNRPQNAPAAAPVTEAPAKQPNVDDKIDPAQDEVAEFVPDTENEVRASGESIDDSFEEAAVPTNEVIVVNDDAGEVNEPVDPVQVQQQPVDAVAL